MGTTSLQPVAQPQHSPEAGVTQVRRQPGYEVSGTLHASPPHLCSVPAPVWLHPVTCTPLPPPQTTDTTSFLTASQLRRHLPPVESAPFSAARLQRPWQCERRLGWPRLQYTRTCILSSKPPHILFPLPACSLYPTPASTLSVHFLCQGVSNSSSGST